MIARLKELIGLKNSRYLIPIFIFCLIVVSIPLTVVMVLSSRETKSQAANCVFNCGVPQYLCDTWSGGFCDDFRDKSSGNVHADFPVAGDAYSFDGFGSTQLFYNTSGWKDAGRTAISQNEHFHTIIDDETFGIGILRLHQPFDFANREGHARFDVDLKTSARRYVRFMLSPELTKSGTDDRNAARRPGNAFDLWFIDGKFYGQVYKNGGTTDAFFIDWPRYYGAENVRDRVDVYITRTHLRLTINGTEFVNQNIPDVGFDRAYMYLSQASYNPCKDGECSEAQQTIHWDNIAFDGPILPKNSLTPVGKRDIVYNIMSATSCTVKGTPATRIGGYQWGAWVTWVARLNDDGSSVSANDISCTWDTSMPAGESNIPRGFEIVKASSGTVTPTDPPATTDTTKPTVSITSPATGSTVSGSSVNITANAADNVGVTKVEFWADGVLKNTDTASPYQYTWDSKTVADGSSVLKAIAFDATNNNQEASVTVNVSNIVIVGGTTSTGSRITWQGKDWYLMGANVPWYNWGCDFGCNANGGVSGNKTNLGTGFGKLKTAGVNTVRWWVFPGNAQQILRDGAGNPTGLNNSIYADFDAALELANTYDLYYNFVLFSDTTSIPNSWLTNPTQRQNLANVLGPLFARYKNNPRVMSWEIFNEPEFQIWNGEIAQAPVVDTVKAIASSVHANSPALVTVGSAHLDGLSMWFGTGLDYYSPHWYDYMGSGGWCARCTDYNALKVRFPALDKPVVIGELYAGADVDALNRFNDFYNKGYAGAWAWSLFSNQTNDKLQVDLTATQTFTSQKTDEGPKEASDSTPPSVTMTVPANTQTVSGVVNVAANAADNVGGTGLSKVDFYLDGALAPINSDTISPYGFSWTSGTVTNGTHTFKAVAFDGAGNQNSQTVSFSVNNTVATCSATVPNDKFHLCFFDTTNPATGPLIGQRDEGFVTSPANGSSNPISHDFGYGGEFGQVDTFSGLWRGNINFPAGTYKFKISGDDGVRLDIGDDGTYEVDQWKDQSATSYETAGIQISGYRKIRVEWYENGGAASVNLSWTSSDTAVPTTPTNLITKADSSNKATLTWNASTDNVGVVGYWVVRNGVTVASSATNSFTDPTVLPATTYNYQVIAYDAAGNFSGLSNTSLVTTPKDVDTTAPSVPATVVASAVSSSQINLAWGSSVDNVGVVAYDVYRNSTKIISITSTSFGDTGLTANTVYSYFVKARDAAGNTSVPSNTISVSTHEAPNGLGSITGRVKSSDGWGIPKAKVSTIINGFNVTYYTNVAGNYKINNINPTSYVITYSASSHITRSKSVVVNANQNTTKNVTLTKR